MTGVKSFPCIRFGKSQTFAFSTSVRRLMIPLHLRYAFPSEDGVIDIDAEHEPFFYNPYCKIPHVNLSASADVEC